MPQPPLIWAELSLTMCPAPSRAMPSPPLPSAVLASMRLPCPAGVVGLDPVAGGLAQLDAALVGAQVVAPHDTVPGQVEDDTAAQDVPDDVLEDGGVGGLGDQDPAGALAD